MTEIVRYLLRRKIRTALTIFAVMVGIFAVTAVGGIAEQLESTIQMVENDALRRINVWPKDYEKPLGEAAMRQLRRMEGVAGVVTTVSSVIDEPKEGAVQILVNPQMYMGTRSDIPGLEYEPPLPGMRLWAGRLPTPGSRTETVVTWSLAQERYLAVGSTLMIRDHLFKVVGIWEDSAAATGRTAAIDYNAAEDMLTNDPFAGSMISVIPLPGADMEALAGRIEAEIGEARADSPEETVGQARQQVVIFSAVVGASGILSLLIGTFTIVNSMVVSVQERRREIGLKKALGAEDGHILGEVVAEAILIAGLGGVLGVLGSAMAGAIANPLLMGKLGSRLFLLTPRLSLGTVAFSVVMGVIAGLFPAWRAARLDPVIALRGGGGALYAGRGFKRLVYLIRRNARSILTVGGIAIGIFALVLLGSLTEALNSYIHDVDAATNDLLLVSPESSDVPMGRSTARVLKRLPGVVDVILTNTAELPTNFTGAEDGEEIKTRFWAHESETGDLGMSMPVRNEIAQGRMVAPGSTDEVVLGAGLAETHHLRVGDTIRIQRREFKVVGIWRRIAFDIGGHDMSTFITIAALERILNQSSGIGAVAVRAVSPETAQALRETIETELPGLTVQTTGEVLGEIQRIFAGLIAVMGGIFSIAVFVGGVSVINTMVIAVNERTREIGLKKALGAEDGDILAEVLLDAAKLGALGGVLGNALAWIAVLLINPLLKAHAGLDMLNLSPRLALAAAVFSLLLGMGAGFLPARRAARLDPVIALRTE